MLYKTRGIFLHKINYSETSLIVHVFTEKFGLQSYLLKGARRKKSRISANILQHLALLNMEVYYRESANLQKIKEVSIDHHFQELPYDVRKSSIALFINEVLHKSIREQEANTALFRFIEHAVIFLDNTTERVVNFHLVFLIQLSRYLGFYPQQNYSEKHPYFDLLEGDFSEKMNHAYMLDERQSKNFYTIINLTFETMSRVRFSHSEHSEILGKLLEYYALHLPGFGDIRSAGVLKTVFS